jgi:hypothetical protein
VTNTTGNVGSPAFGNTGTVTVGAQFGGGSLQETATLVAGFNNTGSGTVSFAWRSRVTAGAPATTSQYETGGVGTAVPTAISSVGLVSDIVNLTGLGGAEPTAPSSVPTDAFVMQMTYNPNLLPKANHNQNNEGGLIANSLLYLASLNPSSLQWEKTTLENQNGTNQGINSGSLPGNEYNGSFQSFVAAHPEIFTNQGTFNPATITSSMLASVMGAYGADPATHVAWAVVNHNSEFAVVPEPQTLVLAALGIVGLAIAARRKRSA